MFDTRPDQIKLRRKFESRSWKTNENFAVYFNDDKVILANQLQLDEQEIVNYLIDGLDNNILQSQSRMQKFKSAHKMISVFCQLTNADRGIPNSTETETRPVRQQNQRANNVNKKFVSNSSATQDMAGKGNNAVVCGNCFGKGHLTADCKRSKREEKKCFHCNASGHYIKNCPQKESKTSETVGQICKFGEGYKLNITSCKVLNGTEINAILDSGRPISLIKEGL